MHCMIAASREMSDEPYFNHIGLTTFIHHFHLLHDLVFDNGIITGSYKSFTQTPQWHRIPQQATRILFRESLSHTAYFAAPDRESYNGCGAYQE